MPPITREFIHTLLESLPLKDDAGIGHTHAAVILRSGKVLANATNQAGSRSKGCGHSKYTIHAERNAIKKLGNKELLNGAILVVVRLKRVDGSLKFYYSEPCDSCKIQLRKHMAEDGLKRVYYS